MTDKLFFNGVNAISGCYGLAPMTVTDLAQHVLDGWSARSRQLSALRSDLDRRTANDHKIEDIVRFLATDILRLRSDAASAGRIGISKRLADCSGFSLAMLALWDRATYCCLLNASDMNLLRRLCML